MMVSFIVNFMKKLSKYSIALFILCCGSAIAQTTSNTNNILKDAENKLVAKVDGESIFLDEILEMAKQLPREYQKLSLDTVFPSLLARAIDARLVRNAGIKKGFSDNPEVKKRLEEIKGQIISEVFLRTTVNSQITEEALQQLYTETKSEMAGEEEVKARHILLNDETKANELIKSLKDGADFSETASKHSTGPSASSGGDLGWFTKGQMVPEFSEAAFKLKPGQIVDKPVKTQFGWHIILVEDRKNAAPPSFDDARGQLASRLSQSLLAKLLKDLRENAKIERFDINVKSTKK